MASIYRGITPTQIERYVKVREKGYVIDVRGVRPILIKGPRAEQFENYELALQEAEKRIADGQR